MLSKLHKRRGLFALVIHCPGPEYCVKALLMIFVLGSVGSLGAMLKCIKSKQTDPRDPRFATPQGCF